MSHHSVSDPFKVPIRPLLTAIIAMAGCSDTQPSETIKQSAVFDEPTVCNAATLSGSCRGPWAYQLYVNPCYNLQTDPACPPVASQCHPSCLHAELGRTDTRSQFITCSNCSSSVLEANCNSQATNYLHSVAGNLAQVFLTHSLLNVGHEGTRWEGQCDMTLQNAGI